MPGRPSVLAGLPVKPFASSKQRLAPHLTPVQRRDLSSQMAAHTLGCLQAAGLEVVVLAADEDGAAWATAAGCRYHLDSDEGGLNGAAAALAAEATASNAAWMICHADLPLLMAADLQPAVAALTRGTPVIAPSSDGGTSLLGSWEVGFSFAYGPGSFTRHLRILAEDDPAIMTSPGLAIDIDTPADLRTASRKVPWLAQFADTLPAL
jgi:2-phospho-L-lactate guanylyltransferase